MMDQLQLMFREWRPISGWPYQVSNDGYVRNSTQNVLRFKRHTNGYLKVTLCRKGRHADAYVHRLVCAAFHGSPPTNRPEADHKNGVRTDNRSDNLEWVSIAGNRAKRNTAKGEKQGHAKLTEPVALAILNEEGTSQSLASKYGVAPRTIRDLRNRVTWKHL